VSVPAFCPRRYRVLAAILALGTGIVVVVVATDLFPYHSANHDEGVYLQQAAMLLDGRFFLTPDSEALREAVHPWFFVEGEHGLYPKYAPVPAAVFALGELAGGYRLALGAVAAANVALVYALTATAFDRPTGLLAGATLATAPAFLLPSSVFLPYAPTTMLNLAFALAYVRAVRRRHHGYAVLAGAAAGLAFFARPYTAVSFAVPFVLHASWRTSLAFRAARRGTDSLARSTPYALTAVVGLAFVALTLAYNAVVTGSVFLFPYEAFAPLDGLGFGRRQILGHEVVYTPALALQSNATVLWTLATRWFTAGPLGTLAAVLGMWVVLVDLSRREPKPQDPTRDSTPDTDPDLGPAPDATLSDRTLRVLLILVGASVVVGNVGFWGNYNILGDPAVAGDGLVSLFGPFYHFDLLAVLAAFAAHGVLTGGRWLLCRTTDRISARTVRVGAVLVLAVSLPVVGALGAGTFAAPVDRHAAYTEKYDRAYEPFRETDTENAVVLLPPEYGEWRNHPFQWLRNDPDVDGPTVYAMRRSAGDDLAVLGAYPDRRYYRYRYHGAWTPSPADEVIPVLERVRVRSAPTFEARTTVTVPDRITRVEVGLHGETTRRYDYEGDPPGELTIPWTLSSSGIAIPDRPTNLTSRREGGPVPIEGPDRVSVSVTLVEPGGGTLTYRETVTVRTVGEDRVQAVWPPVTSVCPLVRECGLEGTYVPDAPETRPTGIATNTTLVEGPGGAT
jgi:hypothetical protein